MMFQSSSGQLELNMEKNANIVLNIVHLNLKEIGLFKKKKKKPGLPLKQEQMCWG